MGAKGSGDLDRSCFFRGKTELVKIRVDEWLKGFGAHTSHIIYNSGKFNLRMIRCGQYALDAKQIHQVCV